MRPLAPLAALLLLAGPALATNWKHARPAEARPSESVGALVLADDRLETLARALELAEMGALLDGPGPVTLWAPSDAAFAALPDGILDTLLRAENRDRLVALLRYHVDDRELRSRDLPEAVIRVKTLLEESRICVARVPGGVAVTDATGGTARVVEADRSGANGVIHVIDRVLVPGGVPVCETPEG